MSDLGTELRTKADENNARAAWRRLTFRNPEECSDSELWAALKAAPHNGVLDRALALLETREVEMETRCEPVLKDWPRNTGSITKSDAVAMQTIVSSFVDALDQVNGVLDTMISSLYTQVERAQSSAWVAAKSMGNYFQSAEHALAAPTEDITYMDDDAVLQTTTLVDELVRGRDNQLRAANAYSQVRSEFYRAVNARVQVFVAWRLALVLEAELAKIAH
jgi:hypothetical protein